MPKSSSVVVHSTTFMMSCNLQVFYSNRVERLYAELKSKLFTQGSNPFTRRIIIVPSPAMKQWLMAALADDPEIGVAAGVEVAYLDHGIRRIVQALSKNPEQFFSNKTVFQLCLDIEVEIRKVVSSYQSMSAEEKEKWKELVHYVFGATERIAGVKLQRRLMTLSHTLAELFINYSHFGNRLLRGWKQGGCSHWQADLWDRTVNELLPETFTWHAKDYEVHLFALSFIPRQVHQLFSSLSRIVPVNYYTFSPCQAFWSDILSDRECQRLLAYWEAREASDFQRIALEEFIFDRNPLLANLGRVGREMALQVEHSNAEVREGYEAGNKTLELPQFTGLVRENILPTVLCQAPSLLSCLQTDLLLMRNPKKDGIIELDEDLSIQVHAAVSPMREVQALRDIILGIIDKHKNDPTPALPEDMIVMAPDIMKYEPYIRAVFGQGDWDLDINIMDIQLLSCQSLIRSFLHLLNLSQGRWEASAINELLESEPFQEKQGFSSDDIVKIQGWMKAADIRWGYDVRHRKEILKGEGNLDPHIDSSPSGTWKHGFERLLMGLALALPEEDAALDEAPLFPLNIVETTQIPLLNKWIRLVDSLREDLNIYRLGSKKQSLKQWSGYFLNLLETYFDISDRGDKYTDEVHSLKSLFGELVRHGDRIDASFDLASMKYYIEQSLKKQKIYFRETHLHAIRFCSMMPMRAIPAKVVILMGMSEDEYPRRESIQSLNMLSRVSGGDFYPSQSENDRYLFLEMLLSARQYFIATYNTGKDEKEREPSLLISELMGYLDTGYRIKGSKPSDCCVKRHPFLPFDKKLFEGDTELQSYSSIDFKAAKAFYGRGSKQPVHHFVPSFEAKKEAARREATVIELKNFSLVAKNPLEAYMKNNLGMYLKEVEEKKDEEDFLLDYLQAAILKKSVLKAPLERTLSRAEKEGKLPLGPFKNYFVEKIKDDCSEIIESLDSLGVHEGEIFEIQFDENTESPQWLDSGDLMLPPLEVSHKGGTVKIVGSLTEVCPEGFLAYIADKKEDIVKAWPQYLVFCCLVDRYELNLRKTLICVKSGKCKEPFFKDPYLLLDKYLDYYDFVLENISPLIPEWVPALVEGDPVDFEKKMRQTLSEKNKHFYNLYMKWAMRGNTTPNGKDVFSGWKHIAEEQYGELYRSWFSNSKSEG